MSASQQSDNSDHQEPQRQPAKAMTFVLFVLLALWIASIAIGTVLFGEVQDWRKPLLVVAPMLFFLSLWAVLLLRKNSATKRT